MASPPGVTEKEGKAGTRHEWPWEDKESQEAQWGCWASAVVAKQLEALKVRRQLNETMPSPRSWRWSRSEKKVIYQGGSSTVVNTSDLETDFLSWNLGSVTYYVTFGESVSQIFICEVNIIIAPTSQGCVVFLRPF